MCLAGVLYSHLPYVPAKPRQLMCIYLYTRIHCMDVDSSRGTPSHAALVCMCSAPMHGTRERERKRERERERESKRA